jgi:hypothetical protein
VKGRIDLCLLMLVAGLSPALPASAQSNDGFHTHQIIPVAVDSASFSQRFVFRAYFPALPVPVLVRYYPAEGTSQSEPIDCPTFTLLTGGQEGGMVFDSLRDLCPGLPVGSQFGLLYLRADGVQRPFAAFTRVSNAKGIGFSIEAFPAHVFTEAPAIVDGIRRRAATASSPGLQTNCFLGNLGELTPSARTGTQQVVYSVTRPDKTGYASAVDLAPGQFVRLLDVFAAAGAPAGDFDNAAFRYAPSNPTEYAPIVGFCTVQDNSSFGADFRIAKFSQNPITCSFENCGWDYMGDGQMMRMTEARDDAAIPGVGRLPFSIPAGPNHQNSHVFYFRRPDTVGCSLQVYGGSASGAAYGLEMRLVRQDQTVAGGDGVTAFSGVYLGDKRDGGSLDERYVLQVESNGQNEASARPYGIYCQSGSGHTRGDTILRDRAADDF